MRTKTYIEPDQAGKTDAGSKADTSHQSDAAAGADNGSAPLILLLRPVHLSIACGTSEKRIMSTLFHCLLLNNDPCARSIFLAVIIAEVRNIVSRYIDGNWININFNGIARAECQNQYCAENCGLSFHSDKSLVSKPIKVHNGR